MTLPPTELPRPRALLAEITYRCPLQCPYCSNPLELARYKNELDTATWVRVSSRRPSWASRSFISRAASRSSAATSSTCAAPRVTASSIRT